MPDRPLWLYPTFHADNCPVATVIAGLAEALGANALSLKMLIEQPSRPPRCGIVGQDFLSAGQTARSGAFEPLPYAIRHPRAVSVHSSNCVMGANPAKQVSGALSRGTNSLPRFGFRCGERGVHGSRTIMLSDLRQLLASTAVDAAYADYQAAIMEENVLGKGTASTRLWSWKKLRELYGLDPFLAVFRCFRHLWRTDSAGRPLLAILCACARDPLLKASAAVILEAPLDSVVSSSDFAQAIEQAAPDRFTPKTLRSMGSNLYASWTQSGHLTSGKTRGRAHPTVSPEATVYSLVLGRLTGARGPLLFSTFWTELLDAPKDTLYELAAVASRRGWIDLRRMGSVVDVGFSKLLTPQEEAALRESD